MKRTIALFLFVVSLASFSTTIYARSYRSYRKHKGFKSKKKEFRIGEVKLKKHQPVKIEKRGPVKYSSFEGGTEIQLHVKTKEQIRTLQELIAQTPVNMRADLYFRLAEHYWENSKSYSMIANRYDDFRGRPEWPEKARLQKQAFATAQLFRKKAAAIYYKIIKNYPNFNRLCESYYFLGKNLFEMGKEKAALNVFRPMLQKFRYPSCPFIPNAYLAFGEYYFNKGQVSHALKAYSQVLNFRNSSIYGFALYKVAWCHYNLVRYRKALQTFVAVIRYARGTSEAMSSGRRLSLLKEALRDLVLTYSQIGDARNAKNFFLNIGGESRYITMMQTLGKYYRQQGKLDKIIIIYTELMRLQPESPRTIFYQLYITRAVNRSKSKVATIREVGKLVRLVEYFRKRGNGGKIYASATKEVADQIKEYAKYRLYEAQKTRRMQFYKESAEFFKYYLRLFPKSKDAYELRFWYAEILYKLRRFDQAAQQYQLCLHQNPKGKYSVDAAYNAILAYNHLLKRSRFDISNITRKVTTRKKPMPPLAKKFLKACEDYIKYFPKTEQAIDVAYKAALLYYYFNHFDEALPRFYFLVKKYPRHEYAIYSAHFILDTYNIQKRWVKLNKTAWKFYNTPNLGNAKFKREVRDLIMQSGFKTCDNIMAAKKYREAANCYIKIAREFNTNKRLACQALLNASLGYYKSKQPEKALRARHNLIENYPKCRYYKKSVLDLATIYASRANFTKAVKYYELYYNRFKTKRNPLWDILIQAALFRKAMGDVTTAMRYYRRLIKDKKFRRRKRKAFVVIYLQLAEYYKKRGAISRYARMMKEFDKKRYGPYPLRLHARMEYALARLRLNFRTEAKRIFKRIPRAYDTLSESQKRKYPRAGYAAAHVRFMEAEAKFVEYTKIRLRRGLTQKAMKKILLKKNKAFKKAYDAYVKVVKYKQGHWGVAAYYRAGDLFLNFAQFLQSAPPPSERELRKLVTKIIKKEVKATITRNLMPILRKNRVPWRARRYIIAKQVRKFMRSPRARQMISAQVQKLQENNKLAIESKVRPIEEKAADQYEKCLRLAHALRTYNKWSQKALKKLQKLRPEKYPPQLEFRPRVGFMDSDFSMKKGMFSPSDRNFAPASPRRSTSPRTTQPRRARSPMTNNTFR